MGTMIGRVLKTTLCQRPVEIRWRGKKMTQTVE